MNQFYSYFPVSVRGFAIKKGLPGLLAIVCLLLLGTTEAYSQACNPQIFNVTGGGTYCEGGAGVPVGLSGSQNNQYKYVLLRNGVRVDSLLGSNNPTVQFPLQKVPGTYTVIVHRATAQNCRANMNGSVTVSYLAGPSQYTITGSSSFCSSTSTVIGLNGSETISTYALLLNGTQVGSTVAGTGNAISFPAVTSGSGSYTVRATRTSTGCQKIMTGSITALASPVAYSVTGGGNYCAGEVGVEVGLADSDPGVTYALYLDGFPTGASLPGTGAVLTFGNQLAQGTYTVIGSASGCSTTMTGNALIEVNTQPNLYAVTGGGNYCTPGTGVPIGLSGSDLGVSYQLYLGGIANGAAVIGTGNSISFGNKTTGTPYTVTASNGACQRTMSGSATVQALPGPAAFAMTGGGSFCSSPGTGVAVGLNGSAAGVNYQLYVNGSPAGSPVAGTGVALSFGNQTTAGTYTAVATRVVNGCQRTQQGSVIVTIIPGPTAFNVTGGGSSCSASPGVVVGLSSSESGVNYQLYRGASIVGTSVPGTGSAITFGNQTIAGTYTVVGISGSCQNTMSGSATVILVTTPAAFTVSGGGNYCSGGAPVTISLSGSASGVSYQLYNNGSTVGAPVSGTGSGISFPNQTAAGTYTVVGTNSGCSRTMTGSATITANNCNPAVYTVIPSTHFYDILQGATLASVTDVDGGIVSAVRISGTLPAGTSLNATTGQITVSNSASIVAGSNPLQIRTTDATGGITISNITITISGDWDSDGVNDFTDIDDNNDGITDLISNASYEPFADADNDGIRNFRDIDFGPAGPADGNRLSGNGSKGGSGPSVSGDANNDGINDLFDFDRDGYINSFDLDMDMDGISNSIEANAGNPPTGYSATQARIGGAVGANGMPNNAETSPESGTTLLPLVNTDLDFQPDYLDKDTDSDGLTDLMEAQSSLGFIALAGSDTDRDGIDNALDGTCGCASPGSAVAPVDTDADAQHDYRDGDSDNDTKLDYTEGFDNNLNGFAVDDLRDRASIFEGLAGNPGWYTTLNSDNNGFEDWLEDEDADGILNYLDQSSSYFHDSNRNGIIDLFDANTFGELASPPDTDGNGIPDFRDGGSIVPLPVKWLSFDVTTRGKASILMWQTTSETENQKFVVERSVDGKQFTVIGEVAGNGTTVQNNRYSFTDTAPQAGINYYRLQQVDFSGKYSYSHIRSVRFGNELSASLSLYPNPAATTVQILVEGSEAQRAEVYSLDGRFVMESALSNQQATLDISKLASGSYVVKVLAGNQVIVKQLLKQ